MKCSSCVHKVAEWARAVARTVLSAITGFKSVDNRAASMAICRVKSTISPTHILPTASKARSSPNCVSTRLKISYAFLIFFFTDAVGIQAFQHIARRFNCRNNHYAQCSLARNERYFLSWLYIKYFSHFAWNDDLIFRGYCHYFHRFTTSYRNHIVKRLYCGFPNTRRRK